MHLGCVAKPAPTNEQSRLCNLALSRGGLTKPISPTFARSRISDIFIVVYVSGIVDIHHIDPSLPITGPNIVTGAREATCKTFHRFTNDLA
jgi:hypothetical protein